MRNSGNILFWIALLATVPAGYLLVANPTMALGMIAAMVWCFWVFHRSSERYAAAVAGIGTLVAMVLVPIFSLGSKASLGPMVLLLIAALGTGLILKRPADTWQALKHVRVWVAYLALLGLTTFTSPIANRNLYISLALVGFVSALAWATMSREESRIGFRWILSLGLVEAMYSLGEILLGFPVPWAAEGLESRANQLFEGLSRGQGTMGHPLPLALLLLVSLVVILQSGIVRSRLIRLAFVVVVLSGTLATGSRSAVAVSGILLGFLLFRNRLKSLVFGIVAIGVGYWIFSLSGLVESKVVQQFLGSDSLSHREGALESLPQLVDAQGIKQTIFGNGVFAHEALFNRGLLQSGNFHAVDNGFVTIFIETGVVGLLVIAIIMVSRVLRQGIGRFMVFVVAVFFFTFDVLIWPSGIMLFAVSVGIASHKNAASARRTSSVFGPRILGDSAH